MLHMPDAPLGENQDGKKKKQPKNGQIFSKIGEALIMLKVQIQYSILSNTIILRLHNADKIL